MLRFRAADDVMADRVRGISAFQLHDGAERVEHFSRLGRPGISSEIRPQFLDGKRVNSGMLSYVERVQMKAERAHLAQQ